ncbi:MAG: MBOAT family protein, partial [Saprospiraceae bacterium]
MIFNSLPFLVFITVFLPLYFALRGRARLLLCLAASYFFYGWWDWRFLSLIVTSTLLDYYIGLRLDNTEDQGTRKNLLVASMVVNLGFLAFFKYFNFFIDSFSEAMQSIGLSPGFNTLYIILPVGISFYTFQSMSYTIDAYYKKIKVEHDFIRFATFISFFPQLVAGPIVRASEFLPQFQKDRKFEWDRLTTGFGQILWGFFKKVAVADSLAPFVDQCFAAPDSFSSLHLLIGVIFYSFQIYCDFSGYSDIAIG